VTYVRWAPARRVVTSGADGFRVHPFGLGDVHPFGLGDVDAGGFVSAVAWRQGDTDGGGGALVAGRSDGVLKMFTCQRRNQNNQQVDDQ
jgi:hypothetical protein